MANPFDVLGVAKTATEAEIKAAFRSKAKECHPDTHPDDPTAADRFKAISSAYDQLKDGKASSYQEVNPFDFSHGFNSAFNDGGFHNSPFQDINDVMRRYEAMMRKAHNKNNDIGIVHTITLEEAYSGKTLNVGLNLMKGHRSIDVKIPAGIDNGARLKVAKAGEDVDQNVPPGDLLVTINILPHKEFHRNGANLVCVKQIDMFTAILGGMITIRTLSGAKVDVTIPKGVDTGAQLRVTNHGMPFMGVADRRGDLLLALEVVMPTNLKPGQIALLEQARLLDA